MITHPRRDQALAVCLAALAGYVDAIAFVELGGFFVSFMSGNSTRLAVGLAHSSPSAMIATSLIVTFVVGVAAGSLAGHQAKSYRRVAVLLLVAVMLAAAAVFGMVGARAAAIAAMALAMGAENAVFEQDGEVRIGVTYMTGTLVKLGQKLAAALHGGDRFGWLSYLMLWLGLVAGAVAGACVYTYEGLGALWFAAAAAMLISAIAADTPPGVSPTWRRAVCELLQRWLRYRSFR